MMKKKVCAALLAAVMGVCAAAPQAGILGRMSVPTDTGVITAQAAAAPKASTLASAAKKPYGNDLPAMVGLNASEMEQRYGVKASWYSSAFAEVPMISASVDELAVFQAKDTSSKKKILKAVKKYQKKLKKDTMQYPMNLLKIQGSRVYVNGNYVCFIMMGSISSQLEENGTQEQQIKAYQKQNKKAVKAIKKQLK